MTHIEVDGSPGMVWIDRTILKFITCKYFGCFRSTAFEANEFEDQIEAYNSYKKITQYPSGYSGKIL